MDLTDLIKAISERKEKTRSYDTTAVVRRIEGQTAWVHIPGGVEETPVKMTIKAAPGDTVQVRIGGGKAWITGNATAPPTDDKVALHAAKTVQLVEKVVSKVKEVAESAQKIAGNTRQYFWFTEEGTDTGAHITEIPQDEFLADPANGGGNLLARTNGIAIRDGLTELATFAASLVEIGKNSVASVIEMCAGKLKITATQYGAAMSTENAYTDGNPGTYYSILTLIARHVYESLSAAASISLWAGTSGQSSRINYDADQHIFSGSVTANNVLRYEDSVATDANDFAYNTAVRLANSHGVTNVPLTAACFVWSVGRNASNMIQFCTAANVSNMTLYMRKCSGGAWGSWKSITFS